MASVIHDDKDVHIYICIYMKPLWKVKGSFNRTSWKVSDVQIVRKTWVLSSFSVSVSVSLSLSLCVVCDRETERQRKDRERRQEKTKQE